MPLSRNLQDQKKKPGIYTHPPAPVLETISQHTARHIRTGVMRDSQAATTWWHFWWSLTIVSSSSPFCNFCIYFQKFIVKFYHISFKITISLDNFIKYFSSIQYFFVIFISCMWLYHQYKSFIQSKLLICLYFISKKKRINKEPARRAFVS